jgi:GTP-binding protein EngB required for normal cell division
MPLPDAHRSNGRSVVSDAERLRELARLASDLDLPRVADEARAIAERVHAGQFYVACVGQFKRGKSTLLNALVGDRVLPTGIVPVTAVPTVLRHGAQRCARVRMRGGNGSAPGWQRIPVEALEEYVSEEHNPENAKGVIGVEVFVPAPLLEGGMCLVDTPGLGSVFEGNTLATREFLPQIDAAIVVIGADPPVSGDELDLVSEIAREVTSLVFVLNKADRVSADERSTAAAFAHRVLERRLGRSPGAIRVVSAVRHSRQDAIADDWPALIDDLGRLVAASGIELARAGGARGVRRVGDRLLAAVTDERAALIRPIEESLQRLRTLERALAEGEQAIGDLGPLFAAEEQRLVRRFAGERATFLDEAIPRGRALVRERLHTIRGRSGPALRRAMFAAAQSVAQELLLPWLGSQQSLADAAYQMAMDRFLAAARGLLQRLADSGAPELAALAADESLDAHLGGRSGFVFQELIRVAQPASPLRHIADLVLGVVGARGVIAREAEQFLGWLLELNSSRVQHDVQQRVADSRREMERSIRALLGEAQERARRVLERARGTRAAGESEVRQALERLELIEAETLALTGRPGSPPEPPHH